MIDDMPNASAQVKARGANLIGIEKQNNDLFNEFIKTIDAGELDAISNIIQFQLLSYYIAVELGNNPDKHRNLAKKCCSAVKKIK